MKIPLGHKVAHLMSIANPFYCLKYNCNNREGDEKEMCFNKPSMTNRPKSTGPTEKKKVPGLTIEVSADTNILSVKLRAIAKHAAALADELEQIDKNES